MSFGSKAWIQSIVPGSFVNSVSTRQWLGGDEVQ
jgi:hypothetical protein